MKPVRPEPPLWGRGLIDGACLVIGTTREEFRTAIDHPPLPSDGHLTAIAWVVDPTASRLLLVRHRLHGWSCPGGHVEPGESPSQTATRELREETAIAGTAIPRPLTISSSIGCARIPGARHWTVGYLFLVTSDVPSRAEPGQPVRWFPLDALPLSRTEDIDVVATHLTRRRLVALATGTPRPRRRR